MKRIFADFKSLKKSTYILALGLKDTNPIQNQRKIQRISPEIR